MIIRQEKQTLSPNKNKIELLKAVNSSETNSAVVLLIGVFHGDEPEGEYLINSLMKDVEETPELIGNNTILFVPCLNPDGKEKGRRVNSNGVDLNRNYPTKNRVETEVKDDYFPGIKPASEIETGFILDILSEYKPTRILTLHSPYKVVNYDGPADKIADNMSKLNGYPVQFDIGYPTPGSFGTYTGKEKNIPTITMELPENVDADALWLDNRKAMHYFIGAF